MASRRPGIDAPTTKRRRFRPSQIAFVVLVCVMVAFAVANFTTVRINWLLGTWRAPLIVALAIACLIGAALGALAVQQTRGKSGR
jgi:uncharacterized integral membrane protein